MWEQPGDRRAAGERGLKRPPASADGGLLRPALELAWAVAKLGEEAVPPVRAPKALQPLLTHARLTATAFRTIRRVVDEDAGFRERVAAVADEGDELGRAGWLFLHRPEGWDGELGALEAAGAESAAEWEEQREERTARRRLEGAEEAKRRAEQEARQARAATERVSQELAGERRARRETEAARAELAGRVQSLERALDAAEGLAAEGREAAAARADQATDEARALRGALSAAEDELARLRRERPTATATPPAAIDTAATSATAGAARRGPSDVDLDAVSAAVLAAARAAEALGAALGEAAEALEAGGAGDSDAVGQGVAAAGTAAPAPPAPRRGLHRRPHRVPVPLPPAIFEDTPQAALHLLRSAGAVLLVDGYNASLAYRPDLPIAELRQRLTDALAELVARTGAEVHVVFDGADLPHRPPVASARQAVRVSFSPAGVEADDVILRLVDTIPADRPVVVASSDRRVQEGARDRGANVISSSQLLAVLGRG